MLIIELIVYIALVGMFVWAIEYMFGDKMPTVFKRAIYVLCVGFVVYLLLSAFGLLPSGFRPPR